MGSRRIISKMKGILKIPDNAYSARDVIVRLVNKYPDLWFEPNVIQEALKKANFSGTSGPYINSTLNSLVRKGTLMKQHEGRKVFFKRKL